MVLWKFTAREVRGRPGRAILTLLSIVISVAAVVSVTVATTTTHRATQDMFESVTGKAALEVVAEGGGFFDDAVVPLLQQTPGVQAAVPTIQCPSRLRFRGHSVELLVMGIEPGHDEAVRDYNLAEGQFFVDGAGGLLETGFANALGIRPGDQVKLLTKTRRLLQDVTIVGTLSPRGAAKFNQGGVVFLPLGVAQSFFAQPGSINSVSLVLDPSADEQRVESEVARRLPTGLRVRRPAARTQLANETLQDVEQGLKFAYGLSIVLAIFLIFNTFLMNVGERRRQLAILRAIGTTRGQIVRMLLCEGLAMGALGTLLGSLVGVGGAYLLAGGMSRVYSGTAPPMCLTSSPFILAAILGPAMSLLAMYVPARIAGMITPLEGMRPVISERGGSVSPRFAAAAILVFVITGSFLVACVTGWLPIELTIPAGVIFTAAFVLLVPIVLGLLAWGVSMLLFPVLRVEGYLAHRQILRRRARTTLTIGVLYIAFSTAVSLGTTIVNHVNEVRHWYARTMRGDFIVRASEPDVSTGSSVPMPESLGNDIRAIDGVAHVDTMSIARDCRVGNQSVLVVVREFTAHDDLPIDLKSGNPQELRQRLAQGEVVIGTVLAQRTKTAVGDEISLETREGIKRLRIAGTTNAYLVGGLVIYMEGATARKLLNVEGANVFVIDVVPGRQSAAEAGLNTLCEQRGLMLHSFAELRGTLDQKLNGVVGSLWGLLALLFVVAAFGIANTLTINVLEQTRDLALLRVVAMTRRQVRKTILSQAAIIGLIGLITGMVGGIIGSYIINLCSFAMLGRVVDFALQPTLLAACFGLGLGVILVAAWIPAERAARLNLLIALQYE